MKHFVVGIDWMGPYTRQGAREASGATKGLYLATGRQAGETASTVQYVGLSKNLFSRLGPAHEKLKLITADEKIWLGCPATAEQSGRWDKLTPRTLSDAEWCHAFFMAPPLNDRLRVNPPTRNVTVLNRWWKVDGTPRYNRPHPSWPDLFDFMGADHRSRVVWFGRRMEVHDLHNKDLTTVVDD